MIFWKWKQQMKVVDKKVRFGTVKAVELDVDDLLKGYRSKYKFKADFNDLFAPLVYSFNKFKMYVYWHYKRELRGYHLARWIIMRFWDLLLEDLIHENDTFKFPNRETYISVKDVNTFRKPFNKKYNIKTFGKDYRIFVQTDGPKFFCRVSRTRHKEIREIGKTKPYV